MELSAISQMRRIMLENQNKGYVGIEPVRSLTGTVLSLYRRRTTPNNFPAC